MINCGRLESGRKRLSCPMFFSRIALNSYYNLNFFSNCFITYIKLKIDNIYIKYDISLTVA